MVETIFTFHTSQLRKMRLKVIQLTQSHTDSMWQRQEKRSSCLVPKSVLKHDGSLTLLLAPCITWLMRKFPLPWLPNEHHSPQDQSHREHAYGCFTQGSAAGVLGFACHSNTNYLTRIWDHLAFVVICSSTFQFPISVFLWLHSAQPLAPTPSTATPE